uniref:Uncharacterized protein n=1 Tax=Romanomermis culicivorax TaxID=13658 RepID=A0A915HIL5_ROMCU
MLGDGLEPSTLRIQGRCSTYFANQATCMVPKRGCSWVQGRRHDEQLNTTQQKPLQPPRSKGHWYIRQFSMSKPTSQKNNAW